MTCFAVDVASPNPSRLFDTKRMKKDAKDLLFSVVPKLWMGACTFGMNVVLLRFFGPEQYGVYALCLSVVVISDAILGSALDLGVMRLASAQREDTARSLSLQLSGVTLKIGALLLVLLATLASSKLSLLLFHTADRNGLLALSFVAVLFLMLLRSAQLNVQIEERFSAYGALEVVHIVLRFGAIATLLAMGLGTPATVLWCAVLGPVSASLLWVTAWGSDCLKRARWSWPLTGELFGYVKWYLATFSLSALVSRIDIFLLASWSNLKEVGLFSAAQALAYVPQMLGTYLSVWLSPKVMPTWRAGRFREFFRKFQSVMLAACVCLYVAGIICLRTVGHLFLPHVFLDSQRIIPVLLVGSLAGLLTFPLTLTFLLFRRPRFLVLVDCLSLPILLPLYRYAIHEYGALGAAWVTSSACVVKATIAQIAAWRLAGSERPESAQAIYMRPESAGISSN